jgi:hypothetical protein
VNEVRVPAPSGIRSNGMAVAALVLETVGTVFGSISDRPGQSLIVQSLMEHYREEFEAPRGQVVPASAGSPNRVSHLAAAT